MNPSLLAGTVIDVAILVGLLRLGSGTLPRWALAAYCDDQADLYRRRQARALRSARAEGAPTPTSTACPCRIDPWLNDPYACTRPCRTTTPGTSPCTPPCPPA